MLGTTVSHYEILERLGGGGMGVVYKARDVRLDRLVALKFLAPHHTGEDSRRRFLREARAASALDHPNLCTLHDVGEAEDGRLFLAMALYEGETFKESIGRGPLEVREAVDFALQAASGLAAAHAVGIVHRDVKPSNLFLTRDGRLKILDFGIARFEDSSRLTVTGAVVGTVAYMSPEQIRGRPVDARTDLWSLGVVLYEMLSGRHPFPAETEAERARAILVQDPEPLRRRRPEIGAGVEQAVLKALAKDPGHRFQDAGGMAAALRAAVLQPGGFPTGEEKSTILEPGSGGRGPGELIGRSVGPYRVLEPLGGGAMGVVYRAEDTRLSRPVALKLLSPELTRDPDAKERFLREARAASALEHPNVCTVFEVGEGQDGRLYLAMPCYEGETLRRRIERGPLPLEEATDVAIQIARGLAKAHRQGIVHRDLKPANLMLTEDGVVKILDFGLAKLTGEPGLTRTGSSPGTPAYMSPEQVRGMAVDHRADLWALGVVLYEMLAGRRPFQGERDQAVLYQILSEEPEPLSSLRPDVPPELDGIVHRLLAKRPEDRHPDMGSVTSELRVLRNETASLTGSIRLAAAPPRRRTLLWAGVSLGLAALAATGVYLWQQAARPEPLRATFTRLTDQPGIETFPSLSPDGELFVYAKATSPGNLDVYLQRVGGTNPINLTADSALDDTHPAYSPDGRQIAFRSEREGGGIFLMGATGESVRRLTDFGFNPAWSPDGKEIAISTVGVTDPRVRPSQGELWRVDVATGLQTIVAGKDAVQPSWSPDDRRITYWGVVGGKRVLFTVPAEGGRPVAVTDDSFLNWNPVWSPNGRFLYFASDRGGTMNLWRVAIDQASGKPQAEPEPVPTPSQSSALLSFSRDGRRILYASDDGRRILERAPFDSVAGRVSGPFVPVNEAARDVNSAEVSPDGEQIVFDASNPHEDLFIMRSDGNGLRRLTDDVHKDRNPRWSPAGDRILFYSNRSGGYQAWTIRPDGSGLERLTGGEEDITDSFWSPDGRRLISSTRLGAVLIDLARPFRRRSPSLIPPPPGGGIFIPLAWSPDGRRLAGSVIETGRPRRPGIFLYSFEPGSHERLTDRGDSAIWLPDSRRLLFSERDRVLFLLDTRTREVREVLSSPANSFFTDMSLSPDGRFLAVVRGVEEGDIWSLEREP